MAELSINQLIKIILGVLVVVAVVIALYFVFRVKIGGFFENLPGDAPKLFLNLIKL